jgi:Protein of unknown function (DUF4038)/Putative collagen-binding domain of a collagenase
MHEMPESDTAKPTITGLTITSDGSAGFFHDQFGNPRLWVASETWGLLTNAGEYSSGDWQGDLDTFFSTRAAQGFTVCMLSPYWSDASNGARVTGDTWDGLTPLAGGSTDPSSADLDSAFWARVDYMMSSALSNGITIGFVLINPGDDLQTGHWQDTWTTTQWQDFAKMIGERYAAQINVVWLYGNDMFSPYNDSQLNAVRAGLAAAGATQIVGAWYNAETTSRYVTSTNAAEDWGVSHSDFDFCYTYNCGYWVIEYAWTEVSAQGAAGLLPPVWGDGYFGQETSGAGYDATYSRALRQEWWWTLASGGRGILGEAENVYAWVSGSAAALTGDWFFANNAPNIVSYLTSLPEWYRLVADTGSALVTAGRGTRASGLTSGGGGGQYEPAFTNNYVAASITPDGSLAVLYLPAAATITIDQAMLPAGYSATWVDPITGATAAAATGSTYDSATQGTNSQGDPDWVLVLQGPVVIRPANGLLLTGII